MTKELDIINDFKTLAIPLDMIAKRNDCTLHYVIKVIHYVSIDKHQEIKKCKELL